MLTADRFIRAALLTALITVTVSAAPSRAQNTPQIPITNATWAGTDDLGRRLPSYAEVGPTKPNRWVGLFYWQWHNKLRCFPDAYNVTEYLKSHPGFRDFVPLPEGGPAHPTWYWAEPIFGYYKSTDAWVIRKHLVMIADAGVDFLFMDYTNSAIYDAELAVLIKVARELRSKGVQVPRIAFFLNSRPEWKIEALYRTWYKPGKHEDMWFTWQGKPLMMSPMPTDSTKLKDPALLPEIQSYFTWRQTWANHDPAKLPTRWRFIDGHPQRPANGPDGKVEQVVVCKSGGGPINKNMEIGGVSCVPGYEPAYDDQWLSKDYQKGLFFEEQWKVAREVGAPILLVTGWNEWTASVWGHLGVPFLGRITKQGQGYLVDQFNMEFNRDIEPMKGGYTDNYYMQFVANMRRYKGMQAPGSPSAPKPMRIDGRFSDWNSVKPRFADPESDIATRDCAATVPNIHYANNSARNDIVFAQVARDSRSIYFRAHSAAPLTPQTGRSWMMLLIDSDCNVKTGWHGFDLLVNRTRAAGKCSVERNTDGKWGWHKVSDAPVKWNGSDIELGIPSELLSQSKAAKFDFKWLDNTPTTPLITDFYSEGDTAPNGRFGYRYEVK